MAAKPSNKLPAAIEYRPERERVDSSAVAMFQLTFPLFIGAMLAAILPRWALPGAAAVALAMWMWRRHLKKRPHRTLRVVKDRLQVTDAGGRVILDATLDDVKHVSLDTKTIERVEENMSSGIPDTRFINSTVGPKIDTSRIEIVTGDTTLLLTEHYTSNIDATDWLSKIRRYLRKHGWTPLHEREGA